jgi:HK97 family phage major capsid protein
VSAEGTWTDIGAGTPPLLAGAPVHLHGECFNFRAIDVGATAANTGIAIIGDWDRYLVVDHSAGASVELVPHVFATRANRPQGVRGLYMTWRFAGVCTDIAAFEMLSIPTTA